MGRQEVHCDGVQGPGPLAAPAVRGVEDVASDVRQPKRCLQRHLTDVRANREDSGNRCVTRQGANIRAYDSKKRKG